MRNSLNNTIENTRSKESCFLNETPSRTSSSIFSDIQSIVVASKANFFKENFNSTSLYFIYRALVFIQSFIFMIAAAFLNDSPLYENGRLKELFRFLSFDISISEEVYTFFFWISGALILGCCSFHFVPNAWILTKFPTWLTYFGQEAFTLTRLFTFPAIRFYLLVTDCQPLLDSNGTLMVVGGKYPGLVCGESLHIFMEVFATMIVILFILTILHSIEFRYTDVERAKAFNMTIFDERAKVYHQYTFIQSVLLSMTTVRYLSFERTITSALIFFLCTTGFGLHLLLEPYYDQRLLSFISGGLLSVTYTSFICFLGWYFPNSLTFLLFFGLVPLAFMLGFFLAPWKRRFALRNQFKASLTEASSIPNGFELSLQRTLTLLLKEPVKKKGDFSKHFQGAPNLFLITFMGLLKTDTSLKFLNLSFNSLTEASCLRLLSTLTSHPTLVELDLSFNQITFTHESCLETLQCFFKKTRILTLHVSHNPLEDLGLKYLAEALCASKNTDLNDLRFSNCKFTSNCRSALLKLLGPTTQLIHLDLSKNSLGYHALLVLSSLLKKNSNLKVLDLSWNRFDVHAVKELKEALQINGALKELHLGSNGIPLDMLESIQAILSSHSSDLCILNEIQPSMMIETLGGCEGLDKIVSVFYTKVFKDPHLRTRFINLKLDRMRFLMSEFLYCYFSNSMEHFRGKSLKDGHAHLKITPKEFDGLYVLFMNAMNEVVPSLPISIQKHISDAFEFFRSEVVTEPEPPIIASCISLTSMDPDPASCFLTSSSNKSIATGFFSCQEDKELPLNLPTSSSPSSSSSSSEVFYSQKQIRSNPSFLNTSNIDLHP